MTDLLLFYQEISRSIGGSNPVVERDQVFTLCNGFRLLPPSTEKFIKCVVFFEVRKSNNLLDSKMHQSLVFLVYETCAYRSVSTNGSYCGVDCVWPKQRPVRRVSRKEWFFGKSSSIRSLWRSLFFCLRFLGWRKWYRDYHAIEPCFARRGGWRSESIAGTIMRSNSDQRSTGTSSSQRKPCCWSISGAVSRYPEECSVALSLGSQGICKRK